MKTGKGKGSGGGKFFSDHSWTIGYRDVDKIAQRTLASSISGQAKDRQNVLEERFSFNCQLFFLFTVKYCRSYRVWKKSRIVC